MQTKIDLSLRLTCKLKSRFIFDLVCKTNRWIFLVYMNHGSRKQTDKLEPLPHLVRVSEGVETLKDVLVYIHVLIGVKQLLTPRGDTATVQEGSLRYRSVPCTVRRNLDNDINICVT